MRAMSYSKIFLLLLIVSGRQSFADSLEKRDSRPIRVGLFPAGIEMLDLASIGAYQQIVFLKQVGQTLIESGPVGEVLPGLAKTWSIKNNGKLYEFKLREAYFHDGSRVKAEDVVYSLHTAITSKGNVASYYLNVIESNGGLSVQSPDSFAIQLTKPYSPLLSMLSSGALVITKKPSGQTGGRKTFIGSGPYRIDGRDGVKVKLSAFEKYSGSYPPRLKQVEVISDADLAMVKRRPLDHEMPDYEVLAVGPRLGLYNDVRYQRISTPAMVSGLLFINGRLKKYADRKARLQLLGLFYKVLDKNLFSHPGRILTDIFPKGLIAHNENRPSFAAYSKELATAPIPDKTSKICVNFHTMLGSEEKFKNAILGNSGISVHFDKSPFVDPMKDWQSYPCDAFFMTWQSVFLDPEANMAMFRILRPFSSEKILKKFQEISDRATAETMEQRRAIIYAELADLVVADAAALPVFQPDHVEFLSRDFVRSDAVYRYQQMFSEIGWK